MIMGWPASLREVPTHQRLGIPYVLGNPARLYMAHPKWPNQPSDELDDRTLYYCRMDIGRHLIAWEQAALAKDFDYFRVPNDAELYHPKHSQPSGHSRWNRPGLRDPNGLAPAPQQLNSPSGRDGSPST